MASTAGILVLLLLTVSTLCITVGLAEELPNTDADDNSAAIKDTEGGDPDVGFTDVRDIKRGEDKAGKTGESPPTDSFQTPSPIAAGSGAGRTTTTPATKKTSSPKNMPPVRPSPRLAREKDNVPAKAAPNQVTDAPSSTTTTPTTTRSTKATTTAAVSVANPTSSETTSADTVTAGKISLTTSPNITASGVPQKTADKGSGSQLAPVLPGVQVKEATVKPVSQESTTRSSAPAKRMWEAVWMQMIWISLLGLVAF